MSDNLIMDFPILKPNCADFAEGVGYEVAASQDKKILTITHTLTGQSFVRQLIENDDAQFSVLLLYRDSSERQYVACKKVDIKDESDKIIAKQIIELKFSYSPMIMPSIATLKDSEIAFTDKNCGLDKFWDEAGNITIPKYARIALAGKLNFTSGGLSSLFNIKLEKKFKNGEIDVEVRENASEGTVPVTLLCGQNVYDQLNRMRKNPETASHTQPKSNSPIESLRYALVTNALCALYAHMQSLPNLEEGEQSSVLLAHLDLLREDVNMDWGDEHFNPCLAATKMLPYMLDPNILNSDSKDD